MWQNDGGDRVVVVVEQAEDINCSNAGRATAMMLTLSTCCWAKFGDVCS